MLYYFYHDVLMIKINITFTYKKKCMLMPNLFSYFYHYFQGENFRLKFMSFIIFR